MDVEYKTLKLNSIVVDPFLIPEFLHIRKEIDYDKSKLEKYHSMIADTGFQEPLKIWSHRGQWWLLDSYECYLAIQKIYHTQPETEISCLVISGITMHAAKELVLKLKSFQPTNSLTRCLGMRSLIDSGCSYQDLRKLYGITKSSSAEAKQLQRDHKFVKHKPIFCRVMGIENDVESTSVLVDLIKPSPNRSTLTYNGALKIIEILNDDQESVERFDQMYSRYLADLQESNLHEEELVKPIYTWSKYNRDKVFAMARYAARKDDRLTMISSFLFGDPGLADQTLDILINESTKQLVFPRVSVNLSSKSDENLKTLVELTHGLESLLNSFKSYVSRIRPVGHGSKIRLQNSSIDPVFDTMSNSPKLDDRTYFNFILRNKLLYYANRVRLLNCLNLKAHFFGFDSYKPDATSTLQLASAKFQEWYSNTFMENIALFYSGQENRHPNYGVYVLIRSYLDKRSDDISPLFFSDFIIEMFSEVFNHLDLEYRSRKELAETIISSDLRFKSGQWNEIHQKLRDAGINEDEVLNAAREIILPEENRLLSMVHKIERSVENLKIEK